MGGGPPLLEIVVIKGILRKTRVIKDSDRDPKKKTRVIKDSDRFRLSERVFRDEKRVKMTKKSAPAAS